MTSDISAVQTNYQKLNELLSQDRDWSIPVDHTVARGSTISEGSRSIHEYASEANGQTTHNTRDTTSSKAASRQRSQSTDRHNSQPPVPQANTYQEKQRTKSDSHNTGGLIKAHRVVSDKCPHHDASDPHLVQQFSPQRRREQTVTTSSSQ